MALAPSTVGTAERDETIRLVAAHRSGDPDAFAEIVRAHYGGLLATARRRLGSEPDAEDAVQDTLLRAYRALHRFGATGDWRLGAWLNRILVNVCNEVPARRRTFVPLPEREDVVDAGPSGLRPDVADLVSDPVAFEAVRRAIGTLPVSQASAFLLRMVDDLPYEEVAGRLGISEDNARARVTRARSALRRRLRGSGAITGLAGVLVGAGSSVRGAFRRVVLGQAPATDPGSLGGSVAGPGPQAASSVAGPLGAGVQLLGQLSSAPVTQALVASGGGGGRTSVVVGIVASLATAGGLAVPAMTGASTPPASRSVVTAVLAHPAPDTVGATTALHAAALQGQAAGTTGQSPTTPQATTPPAVPAWVAAALAGTVQSTPPSAGPSTQPPSPAPSQGTPASSAGATAGSVAPGTTGTAVSVATSTCAAVPGFPGVAAPAAGPALSSSLLDAIVTTGAVPLSGVATSPAFAGTAWVTVGVGHRSSVVATVGTCLAPGGSILAVDLTDATGVEVQLVGSLVTSATPSTSGAGTATGGDVAYLFRGTATQIAGPVASGGGLPWNLQADFVAEVDVQTASHSASLTVVFFQAASAQGGAAGPSVTGTATPVTGRGGTSAASTQTGTAAGASTAVAGATPPATAGSTG